MIKNVVILGSTGSIGVNTLKIIDLYKDKLNLIGISCYKSIDLFRKQIASYSPKYIALPEGISVDFPENRILRGTDGLNKMAELEEADIIVNALVGSVGLLPSYYALKTGKRLALANKESLVIGGEILLKTALDNNAELIPVDSEHSAIHQCLKGEDKTSIKKIILTASGGPFRERDKMSFPDITPAEALKHPNWSMGKRITIDSATLMNKGFEVIEAIHLFNVPIENIDVMIHPQSIIHSMVEFNDNSIIAQLGIPDMCLPIQYALMFPKRLPSLASCCDLAKISFLNFYPPDQETFPCLSLAFESIKKGDYYPTFLNASDEVAVSGFLEEKITFDKIPLIIEKALENCIEGRINSIDDLVSADVEARAKANDLLELMKR